MFVLLAFLYYKTEMIDAGNMISLIFSMTGAIILLIALFRINKLVKKQYIERKKGSFFGEIYRQRMLYIHVFCLVVFVIAAFLTSGFSFYLQHHDIRQDKENPIKYSTGEQFLKWCMMNTLVNLITSTFALYLLVIISESSNIDTEKNSSKNQTIADLA